MLTCPAGGVHGTSIAYRLARSQAVQGVHDQTAQAPVLVVDEVLSVGDAIVQQRFKSRIMTVSTAGALRPLNSTTWAQSLRSPTE